MACLDEVTGSDTGMGDKLEDYPHGQVTFLFTDLVGSTQLWERGKSMPVEEVVASVLEGAISNE